ncbi:hypothetical protein NPIL_528081 [Nephila pilipes]|uniref:Uncharacterized protein n=1 Tax=Nephila pilipes TaxID=299642 RepID=A0A8X6MV18_NEPPI|nr:hypothetical protein NPIL_349901 [Nephila pilipes]GFS79268.1 hypothetical protein NPIL_528081 [Nephila pilipes]
MMFVREYVENVMNRTISVNKPYKCMEMSLTNITSPHFLEKRLLIDNQSNDPWINPVRFEETEIPLRRKESRQFMVVSSSKSLQHDSQSG